MTNKEFEDNLVFKFEYSRKDGDMDGVSDI